MDHLLPTTCSVAAGTSDHNETDNFQNSPLADDGARYLAIGKS